MRRRRPVWRRNHRPSVRRERHRAASPRRSHPGGWPAWTPRRRAHRAREGRRRRPHGPAAATPRSSYPNTTRRENRRARRRIALLVRYRDGLPRTLPDRLADLLFVLRGDFFLQDVQEILVVQVEDLGDDAHAHPVALAQPELDDYLARHFS